MQVAEQRARTAAIGRPCPLVATCRRRAAWWLWTGFVIAAVPASARAQYPPAKVPDLQERSGLIMRFAGVPEQLPPDPRRDNFYDTRYADRGLVKHVDGVKDQGLYGFGWKSACTQSYYPFFYGSPGSARVEPSCLPWQCRSLRFFQGLPHPFKPVGMYYQMGSYVPIYDLDPIAPGPGPYPYPFYYNWNKGG
jgi:hypothetical protein